MRDTPVHQLLKRRIAAKVATVVAAIVITGWGGGSGSLMAQDGNPPAPVLPPLGGLRLRTVSLFADYDSKTLPGNGFQAGAAALNSDVSGGGSVVFEWMKSTERSAFSMNYTPSYIGHVRYSSLNALNHAFSLNVSRKLAPRWTFVFSVGGNLNSVEQSLFSPTTLSNVAAIPSTFDDLAAAILLSKFANNPQLASVLNAAPLVESPVRALLYGQRMFTSSATASLSYSYSPRLSVTFGGGANRSQHVSDDQSLITQNPYLLPNTTSANANAAISYSLSPLTQLGGTVAFARTTSSIQDVYSTTSMATMGRTFGRRWFMQAHGGVGIINPVRQTSFALPTRPNPVFGGSLGLKTFSMTLIGSYDRTVSDSYGIGAATTSSAAASWRWGRPGGAWWLESSAGWQQLTGNALTNTSGWHTSAGFGRNFSPHFALLTQYAYLYYSGQLQKSAYNLSRSAIRVSLVWTPNPGPLR